MSIDNALASVAVTDLKTAAPWYERLFGRPADTSQRSSGDKVKTLMIKDPDGNSIAFAEAFDKTMAR